jgi:DNA-binding transcriptional ArsR family regulator
MQSEEETYSTMFNSLKHPVRRKILRMLSEKPRNFSEMLEALGISSSHLTYHLENLGELVRKLEDGKYRLSMAGDAAVTTMSKVEELPKATEPKHFQTSSIKWKYFSVAIMVGLIILASVSYIYYQSSNQSAAEYAPLADIVKKGALLQSQYTLTYDNKGNVFNLGEIWYCVIYIPYDNSTLNLALTINSISSPFHVPIIVQEGDAFHAENGNSPMIWRLNANISGEYRVQLASKGSYTISLVGPVEAEYIHINNGNGTVVFPMFDIPTVVLPENLDCSVSLSLIHDGKYSPFGVTR